MGLRAMLYISLVAVIALSGVLFFPRPSGNQPVRADGAWNWFTGPRAVAYEGSVFYAHVGKDGDAIVSTIGKDSKLIGSFVLHDALEADDHANPALLVRPDGKIAAFYSAHNGKKLYMRTTKKPGDIRSWSSEAEIGKNSIGEMGYTYPNPRYLPGEKKLYLFWRGADWQPTFSVSPDMGKTWGDTIKLIEAPGQRPYVLYSSSGDRIHIAFSEAHPRDLPTSLYYMYYEKGAFYRADGSFIKKMEDLPILPAEADIVYNAKLSGISSWAWDLGVDVKGKPVLVYAKFPPADDHRYSYVTYDGAWRDFEFARAGAYIGDEKELQYSGGMAIDPDDTRIVYISKGADGDFKMEKVVMEDEGGTMRSEVVMSGGKNVRPTIAGREGSDILLWMSGSYQAYTRFNTSIRHMRIE